MTVLGGVWPTCKSALRCWPGGLRLCLDRDSPARILCARITGPRQLLLDMPHLAMILALHIDYLGKAQTLIWVPPG